MKNITRALLFFVTLITAINSYSDELSDAEWDYQNGWYEDALPVFLSYGTPGLQSQLGDPIAQYYLGEMFYYGEGIEQNLAEAMKWYLLSAEQEDPDAAFAIGFMYENGEGVAQSVEAAIEWYEKGIGLGSEDAVVSLGLVYVYDEGGHKDVNSGINLLETAAQSGNMDAQYYLGSIYYNGEVAEQDFDKALSYFRLAEAQGDVEALDAITWIMDEGQYKKSYEDYVSALSLSPLDEHAFKCENFTWFLAYGLALDADENGNERLADFSQSALRRVNRFGQSLEERLRSSEYDTRQEFREIDRWLANLYEEPNTQLRSRNRSDLTFEELVLLDRNRSGIFEIVFEQAYADHMDTFDEDELLDKWDECTTRHLPDGIFTTDVGLSALIAVFEEGVDQRSIFQRTSDWSKSAMRRIRELSACEGDYDFAGGVLIGTAGTALAAAPSVTGLATTASTMIIGESALLVFSQSAAIVAVVPAIATGVTIAAIAGSTIYATAKGYCYLTGS